MRSFAKRGPGLAQQCARARPRRRRAYGIIIINGCVLLVCCRKIAEQRGPRVATSSLLPQADFSGGFTIRDEIERAESHEKAERMYSGRVDEESSCGVCDEVEQIFLREITCPTSKYLHGDLRSECIFSTLFIEDTRFFFFSQRNLTWLRLKSLIKYLVV